MEPVDVVVVVISYNSSAVIERCLDALPSGLEGLSYEVVVVDNGSTDGVVELLERRDDCHLIRSDNVGYAGGLNRGVVNGPGSRAILVLNPDTTLHSLAGSHLFARLEGDVGVVAPQMVDEDGVLFHSLRREPTLGRASGLTRSGHAAFSEQVTDGHSYRSPGPVDWATGAALLISRDCFEGVGGWDASYFLYSEETDFCLRARDLGWVTQYEPSAVVTHLGGDSGRSARTHSMQVLNRVRLYRRRHGIPASAVYLTLTALVELTHVPRGGGRSSLRAVRDLLVPRGRPRELGLSSAWIPR